MAHSNQAIQDSAGARPRKLESSSNKTVHLHQPFHQETPADDHVFHLLGAHGGNTEENLEDNPGDNVAHPGTIVEQDPELILAHNHSSELTTRAIIAVLLMGPASELDKTIDRAKTLLEYSVHATDTWIPQPLRADMVLDLSSSEQRAR